MQIVLFDYCIKWIGWFDPNKPNMEQRGSLCETMLDTFWTVVTTSESSEKKKNKININYLGNSSCISYIKDRFYIATFPTLKKGSSCSISVQMFLWLTNTREKMGQKLSFNQEILVADDWMIFFFHLFGKQLQYLQRSTDYPEVEHTTSSTSGWLLIARRLHSSPCWRHWLEICGGGSRFAENRHIILLLVENAALKGTPCLLCWPLISVVTS